MRVIVIGAGRGRRLMPTTADAPKCFADVAGKRLIDWAVEAFSENGLKDVCFIGGISIPMPGMLIFMVTSQFPSRIGDCICARAVHDRTSVSRTIELSRTFISIPP